MWLSFVDLPAAVRPSVGQLGDRGAPEFQKVELSVHEESGRFVLRGRTVEGPTFIAHMVGDDLVLDIQGKDGDRVQFKVEPSPSSRPETRKSLKIKGK